MTEQPQLRRIETLRRAYQLDATSISVVAELAVNVVDTVVERLKSNTGKDRLTSLEEAILKITAQSIKTIPDPLARADRAAHIKQDIEEYVRLVKIVSYFNDSRKNYSSAQHYNWDGLNADKDIVEKENSMLLDLARIGVVETTGEEARVVCGIEVSPKGGLPHEITERHIGVEATYSVFKISRQGKELLRQHEVLYSDREAYERELDESNDFPEGTKKGPNKTGDKK